MSFKLLHITATHLNPTGGVPVVLKELVHSQNEIEEFTARVLSLKASVSQINSEYFDSLVNCNLEEYLDDYRPDVVILHSFFYVEYNYVVKCLVQRHIPYLIEPHGSFGRNAMNKSGLKKRIANNTVFRKQIHSANAFVFLNDEEYEDSVYHTNCDLIIPNGYDASKIVWEKRMQTKRTIYYIGRYDINHKGLDYLLEALQIVDKKGIELNVAFWGKGDERSKKYIDKKICTLQNIKVTDYGPVYGNQQSEKLEQFGPMVLTSRYEGFPMTILEAWAYGNPCIVTPGTNMSKEIVEYQLGWATKLNSECIAETITTAVHEYEKNAELYINRCKQYVFDNYSWKYIANISYRELKKLLK